MADGLYLAAHHHATGHALLGDGVLGVGLAGCLLGEALLREYLWLDAGRLRVDPATQTPVDAVVHMVVAEVRAEPGRLAADWLPALSDSALGWVRRRLVRARTLRVEERRMRSPRLVPALPGNVELRGIRLRRAVRHPHELTDADVLLLAVIDAIGLAGEFFSSDPDLHTLATGYICGLPQPLAALVAAVDQVVVRSVAAPRP
ncbi:hypothetical protein Lfu02_49740 [Longispora fulva]|uniref:Putative nucleic acid-binding protein n=1 Tax=Longispora fulva TaxID=619741 RepID=A0A8J7GMM9_9ACTN|nr:GPP34 family phosphoprotein [Longispora fulva]MBG6138350.1 putative nucleic acid-binding protein [Longispora fulva]GIG60602.1 hypothetical protein Lfu02_49740 [Longispora fulva]